MIKWMFNDLIAKLPVCSGEKEMAVPYFINDC